MPFACDSLLWIGDYRHRELDEPWQICQAACDSIQFRRSIDETLQHPPKHTPTRILIGQTSRHEQAVADAADNRVQRLRARFPGVPVLLVRGPLVAASVLLPPVGQQTVQTQWLESIHVEECAIFLPEWLGADAYNVGVEEVLSRETTWVDERDVSSPSAVAANRVTVPNSLSSVVVVADDYTLAETVMDSLDVAGQSGRCVRWQRPPSTGGNCRANQRGASLYLWDESAGPCRRNGQSADPQAWTDFLSPLSDSLHVWWVGSATSRERQAAFSAGVRAILPKPARQATFQECLSFERV